MTISSYRSRLVWTPVLGWVLLACSFSVAQAQYQTQSDVDPTTTTPVIPPGGAAPIIVTPTTPGLPLPSATGTTTADQPRTQPTVPSASTTIVNAPFGTSVPYYGGVTGLGATTTTGGVSRPVDETGIGLGAFTLTPTIELNIGSDSNVFAQTSSAGTVGSPFAVVTPSFDLRSDWLNHYLHVLASGSFGWYASAPSQNFQNYGLLVDGKVDVHHDIWITGATGFRRATEALGTPNVAFASAPTVVDTVPFELGLHQEFNNFFYDVGVKAIRYWHYDNSVITAAGLPAESRDRFEFGESLRVGYHLNEDIDIFVSPTISQTRYIQKVNSAGQMRDSDGTNFGVGVTWKINEISVLEGQVGLNSTSSEVGGSTSALSYGLKGFWTGYAPLTLRPTISRAINETALSNYKNFVSTTYAIDFTYLIHNEWTLAGGLLFSTADYNPYPGSSVGPRTDIFMRGQIGLLYSIKPEIQIGPFFEYSKGSSTDSTGPTYDRQVYSIRLIAKR